MASTTDLLRQAATLHISLVVMPDRTLRASIIITNSGAGHYLPTGADDLRQVWLETRLFDEAGTVHWESGQLNAYGELRDDAVRFGKVLGDVQGQPISLHRFWVATQILSDTRLAPLETRQVHYTVPADMWEKGARGLLKMQVRLLYRDVSQSFAEFALDRPVTDLPTFEMAQAEAIVP
jgi:hypothetical protein